MTHLRRTIETIIPSTATTSMAPAPMPIQTPIVSPVLPKVPGDEEEVPALPSVVEPELLPGAVLEGGCLPGVVVVDPPVFGGAVISSLGLVVELSVPPIETELVLRLG